MAIVHRSIAHPRHILGVDHIFAARGDDVFDGLFGRCGVQVIDDNAGAFAGQFQSDLPSYLSMNQMTKAHIQKLEEIPTEKTQLKILILTKMI